MNGFQLTEGQQNAMDMMDYFMNHCQAPARAVLTGYAGTGKSSLLRMIASQHGPPLVLAPTGKAALRVSEAAGLRAMTIHRWLYTPQEDGSGDVVFVLRSAEQLEIPSNRLIVVDESSMMTRDIWNDLWEACLMANVKVLLVGDPFQLPPVERREKGFIDNRPMPLDIETNFRVHLNEVTRQALESPILRSAMMVREYKPYLEALQPLEQIFSKQVGDKAYEVYMKNGMVICHKNETRHRLNAEIRHSLGREDVLSDGETLSIMRNNYDVNRFNGEQATFDRWEDFDPFPTKVYDRYAKAEEYVTFGKALVDGEPVVICPEEIAGLELKVNILNLPKAARRTYPKVSYLHASYGYATTCHRAQGSESSDVLVLIEDSVRMNTTAGRRWVYTALSRAKDNVSYVMGSGN